MRWSLPIGRVRGIPLLLHVSFLLVLPLLAPIFGAQLSLARGEPPAFLSMPTLTYGVAMVVGLFASVLAHELAHALYALAHGGRVSSITLMLIGGVTRLERAPERPWQEAMMALVGPLTSLALGAGLLIAAALTGGSVSPAVGLGLFSLGAMNLGLGIFNLLPAFPMDGGRILRAALTPRLGALRATTVAARTGQVFAVLFGIAGVLTGNLLLILVGFFVMLGAAGEAQQVRLRAVLEPMTVESLVSGPGVALRTDDSLALALESFTLRHREVLPVLDEKGRPVGVLRLADLEEVPAAERDHEPVMAHLHPVDPIPPDTSVWSGLERLASEHLPLLPVASAEGPYLGYLSEAAIARALERTDPQDARSRHPGPKRRQPA
ncbi:MAG TPA: site-2 protease family protein [Myxococcaceae bacterium]|nr:site-2 protease family protein [Myxococcaceae bacterium]